MQNGWASFYYIGIPSQISHSTAQHSQFSIKLNIVNSIGNCILAKFEHPMSCSFCAAGL
jgi:hypothetical protein